MAQLEEAGHLHPFTLAHVLFQSALVSALSRDTITTFERAERCLVHAREHDFPQWVAWGMTLRGWALAMRNSPVEGVAVMREGLDAAAEIGTVTWRPSFLALLAEALRECGRADAAINALSEALTLTERTGEHFSKAELCRLEGEMILSRAPGDSASAQQCLERAIEIAEHQKAKCLELRAKNSLARLWRRQRKRTEARELLTPIYGWFNEGFESPDLKEAKALLDALS